RMRSSNGLLGSSPRHAAGGGSQSTSSTTRIVSMARCSPGECGRWASEIDRPRRDYLGKNAYAERVVASIRRECVDHVVVLGGRAPADCPQRHGAGARYSIQSAIMIVAPPASLARAAEPQHRPVASTVLGPGSLFQPR